MLFRLDVVDPDVKSWVLAVEGTVTPLSKETSIIFLIIIYIFYYLLAQLIN